MKCSEDEHNLLATNIDLEAESFSNVDICERNEYTHYYVIGSSDVMNALGKLKTDKISDNGLVYSNNFTHGTEILCQYLSILYTSKIYHGFCPASFICANIILIPKGSKVNLSYSHKYWSIATSVFVSIQSVILGKLLDHSIIVKQSDTLTTSQHQYGFKTNPSTVLCSTMVIETVQHYTENDVRPVYVLRLDVSKAFDKVAFNVLFNELRDRTVCPRIIKLMYFMYTNQSCSVKRDNKQSDQFKISNGVKQGGVISPLLFSCYIDNLFTQLQHSGLGCHVGSSYTGAFGYADDIALLAHSLQC